RQCAACRRGRHALRQRLHLIPPEFPMSQALSSIPQLTRAGLTSPEQSEELERVAEEFRVLISPAMQNALQTAGDGVGRQFVPTVDELIIHEGDLADPIG